MTEILERINKLAAHPSPGAISKALRLIGQAEYILDAQVTENNHKVDNTHAAMYRALTRLNRHFTMLIERA